MRTHKLGKNAAFEIHTTVIFASSERIIQILSIEYKSATQTPNRH